jgi:phenylacetate-CoA ligase
VIRSSHPLLRYSEYLLARPPLRQIKGMLSARLAYPLAERLEKRTVTPKLQELQRYYRQPLEQRMAIARNQLANILHFAKQEVPYYRDILTACNFDPEKIRQDTAWLQDLPFLTKDIIREQGVRLLSQPLANIRHHACKTGGSTGKSTVIFYDQTAADYSAAVTLYARERIGKSKSEVALHFACRFPDQLDPPWPTKEDFKCFAMNRSNIFFDRVDADGLDRMWAILERRRPYLIHEHPSTIYALACHREQFPQQKAPFKVFESSGELLQPYMREKIEQVLGCRVVDRYGLAELGIMAYELDAQVTDLQVLESEGWPESRATDDGSHELVFTGFRNRLMPLIRYATGDRARVVKTVKGFILTDVVGRIHDMVTLNGTPYLTHHIMDMLDHRVGGIQEFQIDLREAHPILRIVPETNADTTSIASRINNYWPNAFTIVFVGHADLVRVGNRSKFRHVVTS